MAKARYIQDEGADFEVAIHLRAACNVARYESHGAVLRLLSALAFWKSDGSHLQILVVDSVGGRSERCRPSRKCRRLNAESVTRHDGQRMQVQCQTDRNRQVRRFGSSFLFIPLRIRVFSTSNVADHKPSPAGACLLQSANDLAEFPRCTVSSDPLRCRSPIKPACLFCAILSTAVV